MKGEADGSGFRAPSQGSCLLRSSAAHQPPSPSPLPESAGATAGFLLIDEDVLLLLALGPGPHFVSHGGSVTAVA